MNIRPPLSCFRKQAYAYATVMLLMLTWLLVPVAAAPPSDTQDFIQPYERDVRVIVGSTLRTPDETTPDDAPLFNIAGVPLVENPNVTWGQWKMAMASATAKVTGNSTDVRLELAGLIPGGVYSVFYGTILPDSEHPLCPGVERTLPLLVKKAEPAGKDDSSFIAAADGTAKYRGTAAVDLVGAPQQSFYFIIYHLDGKTYHPLPNAGEHSTYQNGPCRSSFGEDAMRQILIAQKWVQ